MPSTSQPRGRSTVRRSPRPAPRPVPSAAATDRPLTVPVAALFGVLVAAEDGYLAWLLSFGWYLVAPLVLAVAALAGAALVWWGRRGGWLVLALAATLPLLGLLALAGLFGVLGGGMAMWSAVFLLAGPVGCLVLALRRSVREWRGPRSTRSAGGRRGGGGAR